MIEINATSQALSVVLEEVSQGVSYIYVVPSHIDIAQSMALASQLRTPTGKNRSRIMQFGDAILRFAPAANDPTATTRAWGGLVEIDPEVFLAVDSADAQAWRGVQLVCASRFARDNRRTS
ncbi:hypothetical protein [Shimia sagamensis]|uniref:Uncharacterized protein n=1 Tax=Shimia sagamensis TaxID=1566352 RepID=A0ABY1PEK5_9RHOB|nr:hypothetical protein [Shimia sagamensis]SMP32098.1 hypothetical protein SAMN06265373_108128 [Shimia sagamensis]